MRMIRFVTSIAALALVACVVAIGFLIANQSLRQEVADRQQAINQGLTLSQVNSRLVNSLATVAARDNDEQLRALLAQHGITYKVTPGPQAPSSAQQPALPRPAK